MSVLHRTHKLCCSFQTISLTTHYCDLFIYDRIQIDNMGFRMHPESLHRSIFLCMRKKESYLTNEHERELLQRIYCTFLQDCSCPSCGKKLVKFHCSARHLNMYLILQQPYDCLLILDNDRAIQLLDDHCLYLWHRYIHEHMYIVHQN